MRGVTRAVAVLVCLYATVGSVQAQQPVSPRNSYERILVILPIVGSGTAADPMRPSLIPEPGSNHLRAYLLRRMHGSAPNTAQGSCYQNNLSLLHVCRKAHKLVSRKCSERDRRRVRQVHAIRQMGPRPNRPLPPTRVW